MCNERRRTCNGASSAGAASWTMPGEGSIERQARGSGVKSIGEGAAQGSTLSQFLPYFRRARSSYRVSGKKLRGLDSSFSVSRRALHRTEQMSRENETALVPPCIQRSGSGAGPCARSFSFCGASPPKRRLRLALTVRRACSLNTRVFDSWRSHTGTEPSFRARQRNHNHK